MRDIISEDSGLDSEIFPFEMNPVYDLTRDKPKPPTGRMSKGGNHLKAVVKGMMDREGEKVPLSLQKENAELRKLEKKFNKEVGSKAQNHGARRKGLNPELILEMLDIDSENSREDLSVEEIDIKISVRVEKKLSDRNLISDACAKKDHLIDLLNYVLLTMECVSVNNW
jgi:hypothetical protein